VSYRLLHGDALEVLRTLDAESVEFVFTDPPYGHNNNNGDLIHKWELALGRPHAGESSPRPIANDGPEANTLFRAVLPELSRVLKPGGCCCCCCCGGGPDPQFARWSLWLDEVFDFKQMVVWDKGPMGMGWHYRRSYETVLVATKPGAACRWYDTSHKVENVIRARKIIPRSDQHPTEKPVTLAAHFIRLHTQRGDTVLDPFVGSGTTGVACAQLGRDFIGIELSEEYCRMAERRIAAAAAQEVMAL
jgi:site-specific DNA-methyltransferase (adenine-specific)